MSQSPDDQLFEWVAATIGASPAVAGIVKHDVVRDDHATQHMKSMPRIEYNPFRYDPQEGGTLYRGEFGVTIHHSRENNRAYGGGDLRGEGELWTLEAAVIAALANVTPTLTGFGVSPIEFSARPRPTKGDKEEVTRRLGFLLNIFPGGTAPLSGNDADLQGLSPAADVLSWFVTIEGGTHSRFTTKDHDQRRMRPHKPICRVSIRVRIPSGVAAVFPAYGSRQSITLVAGPLCSFAVSALITAIVWDPNQDQRSRPQYATIRARIDENSSGIFSGSA